MNQDWYDDDDYEFYQQEAYEDQLYRDFAIKFAESGDLAQAVEEEIEERFEEILNTKIKERLRVFYLSKPHIAEPALALIQQSQHLLSYQMYSPAQVFAGAATEIIFKRILFIPIVHNFVPVDSVAQLVVEVFSKNVREIGRFKRLLIHVVELFSGINVLSYIVNGSTESLWNEAGKIRQQRNDFLHEGKAATKQEAELSIEVATTLLDTVFDALLNEIRLHRHPNGSIQEGRQCQSCPRSGAGGPTE